MNQNKVLSVKNVVLIGMFGGLSAILAFFQISVPFAPPFYKIDFCEVPALIGAFAMGPVAGVLIVFVKIVIKLITQGTTTMYVGDLGNFLGSIAFVIPAAMIYKYKKTKKGAMIALAAGVVIMVLWSIIGNVYITLPFYGKVAFDGVENIIAMGSKINGNITNMLTFVLFAIVPFNLLKGSLVAIVTAVMYKRVSIIIHMSNPAGTGKKSVTKKGAVKI